MLLVALGIVARGHRDWIAVDLARAAASEGVSPQRLSRLVTRAIAPFEAGLAALTRRGRPRVDREQAKLAAELSLCRALLEVATSILAQIPLRRRGVGALIVGAWLGLKGTPGLTQQRFCQALSLPPRTLRSWIARAPHVVERAPAVVQPPRPPRRPRQRPPRRPRFTFDVVLPGTQFAGDTTDLSAFGVALKLVATQDVGGRDQELLASIVIDDHEDADTVVAAMTEALTGKPGAQVIVDQGKPYMAGATIAALDQLEAEHAPQREGDPQAKSTLERAFGTVKAIAAPLLRLTDRIAAAVPAVCDPAVAAAAARLVVTALLRAYQAGARAAARAAEARGAIEPAELERRAEEHREQARATDRSARLLLGHVHDLFNLPRSRERFINSLRRYPLPVLQQAERAFRDQVHRDDIRDRQSYFAAIVRRLYFNYRNEQRRLDRERDQKQRRRDQQAQDDARDAARRAAPTDFLREGLAAIAAMWLPAKRQLFCGGTGVGTAWLAEALALIVASHGAEAVHDIVRGVFDGFRLQWHDRIGDAGLAAVKKILETKLDQLPPSATLGACSPIDASAILGNTGPKQRPPPSAALRN